MPSKDVVLSINMSHRPHGEREEKMEFVTCASYTREGDVTRIEYEESELTGLEGAVTRITLEGERMMTLERQGAYNMVLVLEEGKQYFGAYATPYGALDLCVSPSKVRIKNDEGQLDLHTNYEMSVAGGPAGVFDMHIHSAL